MISGQANGSTIPEGIYAFDPKEVLLQYQKEWIADESQVKLAEKSRRTGLTWAEAADASLTASKSKAAQGDNHFYVGSNKEMAIEFIEAAAMWAKIFNKAAGEIEEEVLEDEDKDILTFTIRFASGFKVQALSSRPSNMRGRQGNVTIDEAAFHDALAELLKAALALTMWGSKVRIISTHNGVENLFNELVEETRAGKKRYSIHRITLDNACTQGLYKRICQIRGLEWSPEAEKQWKDDLLSDTATTEDALEEYYCVPKSGGGAYLSRALIESRMVAGRPILRFEGSAEFNARPVTERAVEMQGWCDENLLPLLAQLNPENNHVLGEDFARSGDLTVLAPMEIAQQLQRNVPFLVELRNVPFAQQKQVLFYIIFRLPRFQAAALDARGNGQNLAEDTRDQFGNSIQTVMLAQNWYLENMPKLKAAFEDGEITIPKDRDVLDDLRAVQVIKGIPKIPEGKTQKQGKQRHGDAAVALVMAIFAALVEVEHFGYIPVKPDLNRDSDRFQRSVHVTAGFKNRTVW